MNLLLLLNVISCYTWHLYCLTMWLAGPECWLNLDLLSVMFLKQKLQLLSPHLVKIILFRHCQKMYHEWVFVCPQPLKVQVQVSLQKTPWVHFWPQGQGEGRLVQDKGGDQGIGTSWVFRKTVFDSFCSFSCWILHLLLENNAQMNHLIYSCLSAR